jgi:hypothetical protein
MKNWSIDRLALTVPGYSERQAHELSQLIAAALVEVTHVPEHLTGRSPHSHVEFEITARDGEAMPQLARRIVAALVGAGQER